ncbi:MAG: aminotransferase class V-fold PLP-dependent enzyme [Ruminococcaceae bacterium]|nr:aminotransferase class V-fold PLP-dependent enzyme [Oscillospiraceae bacterium]
MKTPICDFAEEYRRKKTLRLHMPGHKGEERMGFEGLDITEINGADSLYEASGIIRESEENASRLFGAHTLYSTEGSSQCIRAMLCLAMWHGREQGSPCRILAARNAHKTFLTAVALLDIEVSWLPVKEPGSYLAGGVNTEALAKMLSEESPTAVYLTSPDYLGGQADVKEAAALCHKHGALLLVDNAHGAYLKFLNPSEHPMDLGADLCCDSAHKTLHALTGAAYLHISKNAPAGLRERGREAMALFGSTSPSYLILQSLDRLNAELAGDYPHRLSLFLHALEEVKTALRRTGYTVCEGESLKLTLQAKPYGYTGQELAARLEDRGVVCEFADPDYLVLMLTPSVGEEGLRRLSEALRAIPRREAIAEAPPTVPVCPRAMSPREAMLSPCERLPVERCVGRILSSPSVGCPPAVPILISGERITEEAVACFRYYGVEVCSVVKEPSK